MADISTPSSGYIERQDEWQLCRDVIKGAKAVKAAGETYLPRLSNQDDEQYAAFLKRALFFAATSRTAQGLVGMIFRKPAVVTLPTAFGTMATLATADGHSLDDLLEAVINEVIEVNYAGLLVDYPEPVEGVVTAQQAEARGIRPYLSMYIAEAILGVDYGILDNKVVITRVRLVDDESTIRELTLVDGVYTIIMHKKVNGGWQEIARRVPLANGLPLGFIPFVICSDEPVVRNPPKPLLWDLADVNISHFQTSASLDHGCHFTATPLISVSGVDKDWTPTIGGGAVWRFESADTKVNMNEFAGTGLSHLRDRAAEKAAMMVTLGARILATEKAQAETAETHDIKRAGENSVLASLARTVSRQVTKALQWMAAWANISGDVSVELNTDYSPAKMTAQELTAWVSALQSGAVSRATFFEALQSNEMIKESLTLEDEQERLAESFIDSPPTV